jgi:hypothetical protein
VAEVLESPQLTYSTVWLSTSERLVIRAALSESLSAVSELYDIFVSMCLFLLGLSFYGSIEYSDRLLSNYRIFIFVTADNIILLTKSLITKVSPDPSLQSFC